MMQPSANGIAALFQGNPAALQQRVQKEQQAQPGLPPDLKELMALQILTEKTDAAQRQQAMNQLNQAGGPNMPTVAQTLQERAKQALQARMMQAQQQAQMPPQPQPIPTAPPADQPEVSPEMMQQLAAMQAQGTGGLDQLQSNVGNFAGGGIIAFNGEERSDVPDERLTPEEARDIIERMKERTASKEEVSDASNIKKALAFAAGLPAAAADIATLPINALRRYVRNPLDTSEPASLTPVSDIRSEYLNMNKEPAPKAAPQAAPVREAAPQPQGIEAIIAQRAADLERKAGRQMSPEARELFTQREMNKFMAQQGIVPMSDRSAGGEPKRVGGMTYNEWVDSVRKREGPLTAEQEEIMRRRFDGAEPDKVAPSATPPRQNQVQAKPPASAANTVTSAQVPAPTGILTPEQASQVKQVMMDRLNLNPYERERMAREEAEKFIGAPETASLQTLADELAAKRQSIARQREENQGLREWMRGIALAPRGLTSAGSAVAGSEYVRGREKQFEIQDFEALQKMLDTQAKISDVKRGWRKDLFTLGKAEFDKVYKDKYDAAKALGESDDKAKKLAQEAVLEADRLANAVKVAGIYAGPQQAANARTERAIQSMLKKPGNEKMTYDEALLAVTSPTSYLAPDKQKLADLRAAAVSLATLADPMKNSDEVSQKQAQQDLIKVTRMIAQMGGAELGSGGEPVTVTAGGKTYSFPNQAAADKFKAQAGIK